MSTPGNTKEIAVLAGGCFWCVEAVLEQLRGVEHVESGYAGGHVPNPTYQQICTGTTGHAEVVRIRFDSREISYQEILNVFFMTHDPTTLNRQGPDVGDQYRSAIFYITPSQKEAAEQVTEHLRLSGIFDNPIVTEICALETFYPGEDYHQEFFRSNPYQPYCQVIISPKVAKFRKEFSDKLKSEVTRTTA
ncbi:MAG: peptide-methionine (S)-S-oxide reductase [SAR202 cluster bacterium Io17-Chloro-G3]|nr:MAG: peptide-methionine (S)-S-oxide reductase [SAR202 cluster bacterium Io17-Chloro-G3]